MKKAFALTTVAVLALGLSACSGNDDSASSKKDEPSKSAEATSSASATPTSEATSGTSASGDAPAWAVGSTTAGEKVGEITTKNWKVDIYQVGTAVTEKDSMFVDPTTNKNVLPAGSEVVFFNAVYTNTSSADIPLSISLGKPDATATSWKFSTGQPGSSKEDQYKALDLSSTGYKVGEKAPYVVKPGQSFAQATNIEHKAGEETEFKVTLIQADEAGKLLHDTREEGETTFTQK